MSEGARLTMSMPAAPEALDLAHDELARLWVIDASVSANDRMRFELAVIEILGNIVEHAWNADDEQPSARRLSVELCVARDRLEAVLGDNGIPVSVDLSAATMPDADAESGRGLALTLAAVDALDYERDGGCNRWRIRCDRRPA
jgi:serine/threonine-protein kinase RsbW